MSTPDADRALARIAAKQYQRFTRAQALRAGFSTDAVRHKLETGRWTKETRTVYAFAGAPQGPAARLCAALLGCPEAAASHLTSAFVHGLTEKQPAIVDISISNRRKGPRLPGVRVHRVRDLEVMSRMAIRVTTVARTIVDLASTPYLEKVLDAAIHQRKTTVAKLKAYIALLRTNPGLRRLRTLLEDREKGRVTTELERRFDELLKSSPLPYPARQYPIGTRSADFAYVEKQIVIELDGGDSHMRKDVFEDDRARQNELVLNGWTILRFTWDDVTKRSAYVVRTIDRMLATRGARGRRP